MRPQDLVTAHIIYTAEVPAYIQTTIADGVFSTSASICMEADPSFQAMAQIDDDSDTASRRSNAGSAMSGCGVFGESQTSLRRSDAN